VPGGALVGSLLCLPIILLAGIYFLERPGLRLICVITLSLWIALQIVMIMIQHNFARLFFPGLIILFWVIMAGVERRLKD
jgi:hypothetical protein